MTAERLTVLAVIAVAVIVASVIARAALRRRHALSRFDLGDIAGATGDPVTVVEADGVPVHAISLAERPEVAARYKISVTPRVAVASAGDGTVLREFDHYTPRPHDLEAIARLVRQA
jgi:hypothetical protein